MINYKPKRITFQKIWEITEDFRSQYKYANEFPVKVEELIEFELKLDIISIDGLKEKANVEAFLSHNLTAIRVDKTALENPSYLPRLRFTLAEEVGHFVLHKEIYEQGVKYESTEEFIDDNNNMNEDDLNWIERQARQFAGRLLVPLPKLLFYIDKHKELVDLLYERYDGAENVAELAIEGFSKKVCAEFEVSWEVICYRISYEKLNDKFER